jgi:amino acid transporter
MELRDLDGDQDYHSDADPLAPLDHVERRIVPISLLHFVSIAFFYSCAGPYGQEEAISAGGALVTFIGTVVVPIVFAVPMALTVSELSARMPKLGGEPEWGLLLGKPVAIVNGYLRFCMNVFDNAVYPTMIVDYIAVLIPAVEYWYVRLIIILVANFCVLSTNAASLTEVGWISSVLAVVIVTPFALFFFFATRVMSTDTIFAAYPADLGSPDYVGMLGTLIWQYGGWDSVASISSEVVNPSRTFPVGFGIVIALETFCYLSVTIAGVSIEPHLEEWSFASFATVANKLPYCKEGWLSFWISLAGTGSALALLNSAIALTGREL